MRVEVDARGTFDGRNQDVGVPPGAQHLVVKRLAVLRAENGIATAQQRTSLISLECLLMTQSGHFGSKLLWKAARPSSLHSGTLG